MALLLILTPMSFSKVSHIKVIRVFHGIFKRPTIPLIEPKQYALSNFCRITSTLCALVDNGLKNYHPLSIPLPGTKPIKFYRQDYHKYLPKFTRMCVIVLDRHTNKFFHRACHLLSSAITPSKCSPGFWCTQSW